jgi:UDP-N-acetylmuramate dehydrogenase
MLIERNASLRHLNSFGVAARAAGLARVRDLESLPALLDDPAWRERPVLVLGGGSNVLFTRDVDGLVLKLEASRIATSHWVGDDAVLRVEAGRDWHEFVRWTLDAGFTGLENLSLIPGTVGAAPIQNIGAYGVELAEHVDAVEVYDRSERRFDALDREQCRFGYRDSVFKSESGRERWIVTAVRFRLRADRPLATHYAGVAEELVAMGIERPTARDVSDAICAIRRRKLPDPARVGNAGSFFKNPVVELAQAQALAARFPGLPVHAAGAGRAKLSAAWLIEHAGLKGHRDGDAGVSAQHALVLVNHGNATGGAILALAHHVQDTVRGRFGVDLVPEPLIL